MMKRHSLGLLVSIVLAACNWSTNPDSLLPSRGVEIVVDSAVYHLKRLGSFGLQANVIVTIDNGSSRDVFLAQHCGYYSVRRKDGSRTALGDYACAFTGGLKLPDPIRVAAGSKFTKAFDLRGSIQPQAGPPITLQHNVGEMKFTFAFTNAAGTSFAYLESAPFTVLEPGT